MPCMQCRVGVPHPPSRQLSLVSLPHTLRRYGPGPEHGGDHEHEALRSVQLAGSPLPLGPGSAAKQERQGLVNIAASSSRQGW